MSRVRIAEALDLGKIKVEEKKEEKKSKVSYVVFYYFTGKMKRAGVGHAALWDGKNYYSYYGTTKEQKEGSWISSAAPMLGKILESKADDYANDEKSTYGKWKKIIIPVGDSFDRNAIEEAVRHEWKTSGYRLGSRDCVHQVQDQLIKSRLQDKPYNELIILRPGNLDTIYRKMGLRRFEESLKQEKSKPSTLEQIENRRDFLMLLHDAIVGVEEKALPTEVKKVLVPKFFMKNLKEMSAVEVNSLFFEFKESLAKRHYKAPPKRRTASEAFYAKWYALSLVPDPKIVEELKLTLPGESRESKLDKVKTLERKAERKSDSRTTEQKCDSLVNTILVLTNGLREHYEEIEKKKSHAKDFKPIFTALYAEDINPKEKLHQVLKTLLNIMINRVPKGTIKESELNQILAGDKAFMYIYYKSAMEKMIVHLNKKSLTKKDKSMFGRGLIEIMRDIIDQAAKLGLTKEKGLDNLIKSMEGFVMPSLTAEVKLPLEHCLNANELTANNATLLTQVPMAIFKSYVKAIATVGSTERESDNNIIIMKAMSDGADPRAVAKIILVRLLDSKAKLFGAGKDALKQYEIISDEIRNPEKLRAKSLKEEKKHEMDEHKSVLPSPRMKA